ncbi:hypothetical protein WJX81_004226 [Elliptochloris bilobata]|uniref:Palmitoyl-protein thioesterase 1 n=1 Tax=Elliptochloris bilobata TaxID=381761 RepID=A0AAW1SA72_9CHLO
MGDSCCNNRSIGAVRNLIAEALPGTFVFSLATGRGAAGDTESSFFGNVNEQVENVCNALANITELRNGYNGVGFSQGGQFMRALVERCQHRGPRMHTLVTLGGQHQGVMNVPLCWNPSFNATPTYLCRAMQSVLGWGAYLPWIRDHVIQAQYFKDPWRMADYLRHNAFLADINNERGAKNALYRENLVSLERLVLVRFSEDYTVVPRDSAWFAFYDGKKLQGMRDTALYQEDWIGLRELDERGRVVFDEIPGAHMHFTLQYFQEHVVDRYLKGSKHGFDSMSGKLPQALAAAQ